MNGMAVATSGDYQRYFVYDGKRYHHLIAPETLYPAEHFRSMAVVCKNAADADLFSTALFLCGIEKERQLADKEDLAVLWITNDGKMITNGKIKELFKK